MNTWVIKMKEIIYNNDNLNVNDINNVVKRAKAIIVNSKGEILLGCGHNNYQIIGGHVEENETYKDCLIREVKEETGITIDDFDEKVILTIKYYCKDYPSKNLNTLFNANYYVIKTDQKPNMNLINLTENEKEGMFEFKYISKNDVINELVKTFDTCKNKNTLKDTIYALIEYLYE